MPVKMPVSVRTSAVNTINANLQEVKRARRRLEFCLEYVVTGRLDKAFAGKRNEFKEHSKRKSKSRKQPESFEAMIDRVYAKKPKVRHKKLSKSNTFIASPEWKELRQIVINHYGATCMKCGGTSQINVDHIKPKSKYPELALSFDNQQVLCWPCNKAKGIVDETDYR